MSADRSGPRPLHHLLAGVVPQREWLTMAQLAEHGRFMAKDGRCFSPEAARKFVSRHPELPRARRGTQLLVDKRVFDDFVTAAGRKAS